MAYVNIRENNFRSKKQGSLCQKATYAALEFTNGKTIVYESAFATLSFHVLTIGHERQ